MTVRAIGGLLVLNALYAGVGTTVLWALRGFGRWTDAVRLLGVAYLVGLSVLGIGWTVLLALGVPFGPVTIAATCAAIGAVAAAVARARGLRLPRGRLRLRITLPVTLAAVGGGALAVYALEVLRVARVQGVFSFDGWAFWVTRGKAIFFFDRFDEQVFAAVPHPSYPPVVPILDAAAFHAMGSADTVTLHVQYWLLAVGFTAAVAGLLAGRVPGWILWPSLVLALVLPRVRLGVLAAQADFPLQYLVGSAAVLVALWIVERRSWQLHGAGLMLACGVLVKREGLVLAACVLVAALIATLRTRDAWPRLIVTGIAVAAATLPWRLWYGAHGIEGELGAGGLRGDVVGRTLDSLELALDVLWDVERWSVVPTIGVVAVVLAAAWGRRAHAAFAAVLVLALTLAAASTSVVFPEIAVTDDEAVNPVVRLTAGTVLAISCLTPLLLAGVWAGRARRLP